MCKINNVVVPVPMCSKAELVILIAPIYSSSGGVHPYLLKDGPDHPYLLYIELKWRCPFLFL